MLAKSAQTEHVDSSIQPGILRLTVEKHTPFLFSYFTLKKDVLLCRMLS